MLLRSTRYHSWLSFVVALGSPSSKQPRLLLLLVKISIMIVVLSVSSSFRMAAHASYIQRRPAYSSRGLGTTLAFSTRRTNHHSTFQRINQPIVVPHRIRRRRPMIFLEACQTNPYSRQHSISLVKRYLSSTTVDTHSEDTTLPEQESEDEEMLYQELRDLAAQIRHYDDLYYNTQQQDSQSQQEGESISDDAYDALVAREAALCISYPHLHTRLQQETNNPLATRFAGRVGIAVDSNAKKNSSYVTTTTSPPSTKSTDRFAVKRTHGSPMKSLENIVTRSELEAWLDRIVKSIEKQQQTTNVDQEERPAFFTITTEPKLDGLSLSLRYTRQSSPSQKQQVQYTLQWAATRGDGKEGQDVTFTVRSNHATLGIPLTLSPSSEADIDFVEVRGEVVFPDSIFAALPKNDNDNENNTTTTTFSNPRNAASGILLRKESNDTEMSRHLRFYAYDMASTKDIDASTEKGGSVIGPWSGVEIRQKLAEMGFQLPFPFVTTHIPVPSSNDKAGDSAATTSFEWQDKDMTNMLEYHYNLGLHKGYKDPNATRKIKVWKADAWSDYGMDGCVHKVSEASIRATMGENTRAPKWAVAHKFPAQAVITRLQGIEVQVGRTGSLTPVAILEPVDLNGITVQRATLHNFAHMQQLLLDVDNNTDFVPVGIPVMVRRAGDVIPQVVQRVSSASSDHKGSDTISLRTPERCPACGSPVEVDADLCTKSIGQVLRCTGPQLLCEPRAIGALVHAYSRDALNVKGLSEARIRQLMDEDIIRQPSDLFSKAQDNQTAFIERLVELDGWGEKSAGNLVHTAQKVASEGVPLSKFIYSLGIRFVGQNSAALVSKIYRNVDSFLLDMKKVSALNDPHEESYPALREENEETKGIGPSLIGALTNFSLDSTMVNAAVKLRDSLQIADEVAYVEPKLTESDTSNLPFAGLTIVFTGTLPGMSRTKAQEAAFQMGAKGSPKSVTKLTGLVVSGKKGGKKLEQAKKLGVRVIEGEEFVKMVEGFDKETNLIRVLANGNNNRL